MDYKQRIALGSLYRTATLRELVADYEGDERRKNQQRRDKSDPRRQEEDRRGEERGDDRRDIGDRRLPTFKTIGESDLVIELTMSGIDTIYDNQLNKLGEFPADVGAFKIFDRIIELSQQGKFSEDSKLYTVRVKPADGLELETTPLNDITNEYKRYVSTRVNRDK